MADYNIIRVFDVMDNHESVSGTHDGYVLAHEVEHELGDSESTVMVDFDKIISLSNSAACAFWKYIFDRFGISAIERTAFTNPSPLVLESLEYGVEFALGQIEKPPSHELLK